MRDHIATVVGRYKGRISGWDVVNEALNEDGTLRQRPWLKIIGEDYIAKAFQFAHEADPNAELYYNDYSVENPPKRDGAVRLIKKLQDSGIKVHAMGLQGHDKMEWPTLEQQTATIEAFKALGIKVKSPNWTWTCSPRPRSSARPMSDSTSKRRPNSIRIRTVCRTQCNRRSPNAMPNCSPCSANTPARFRASLSGAWPIPIAG